MRAPAGGVAVGAAVAGEDGVDDASGAAGEEEEPVEPGVAVDAELLGSGVVVPAPDGESLEQDVKMAANANAAARTIRGMSS